MEKSRLTRAEFLYPTNWLPWPKSVMAPPEPLPSSIVSVKCLYQTRLLYRPTPFNN